MPLEPQSSSSAKSSSILVGMAIIGKNNEPLYLCDCEALGREEDANEPPTTVPDHATENQKEVEEDPFGFIHFSLHHTEQRNSLPLSGQILMHAALDALEERIERPGGGKNGMPVIRPTASSSSPPPHWLGLLLHAPSDGYSVYGYITATNLKLLALTKDVVPQQNAIASKLIQNFLQEVHQHLIAYMLNPFCDTRGGALVSQQLDRRIAHSIANLRQSTAIRVD